MAILTGSGTASIVPFRGSPQIHSRVEIVRHRHGVRRFSTLQAHWMAKLRFIHM